MRQFSTRLVMPICAALVQAQVQGCASDETGPAEPVDRQAMQSVEDGYVQFFIGEEASKAAEEGRTYTPAIEDWYTRITVPGGMIEDAEDGAAPTVSFCGSNDVFVYDHVFVGVEQAVVLRPDPPDPVLSTTDDGELIQEFHSGQDGIYGIAQVHRNEAGFLVAGVAVEMRIVVSETVSRSASLFAGVFSDVPTLNDARLSWDGEVIRGCDPPLPESDGP